MQGEERGGSVEPDGVVGCVEVDDVFSQCEDARRVFAGGHYSAEITHCCYVSVYFIVQGFGVKEIYLLHTRPCMRFVLMRLRRRLVGWVPRRPMRDLIRIYP